MNCHVRTIDRAVDALTKFGFEIISFKKDRERFFYVPEREFSIPELKIMMDAVQAASFVTEKKTKDIKNIHEQSGRYANTQMRMIVSLAKAYSVDQVETALRYCIRVGICTLNEVQSYLLYRFGVAIGKRKMTMSVVHHCKKRAEEIVEEQNGRIVWKRSATAC